MTRTPTRSYQFYIHCSMHHCNCLKNNQHDVTCGLSFIFMGSRHSFSTCFELPESSKHVENEWRLPMKIKDSPQVTSCWLFFKLFFENLSTKSKFHWNPSRITGTWRENQYTCLIISRSLILRMTNVSDKVVEKIKTHFMLNIFFLNRVVYEIMWKK